MRPQSISATEKTLVNMATIEGGFSETPERDSHADSKGVRVLRVLGAVAYVGATALLWYELEQPVEEATSFGTFVLLFPVLAFVFALLTGRWWFVLVPLAIIPVTSPTFQSGCGGSGGTEICTQHIAMLVTFFSFGACVVGMLVYMAGRELLVRRSSH